MIDRTSHCGGGDNPCPLGQTGQKGKQVRKKIFAHCYIFLRKNGILISLCSGACIWHRQHPSFSRMLPSSSGLPFRLTFKNNRLSFHLIAMGDSYKETQNVVVKIDIHTPGFPMALVFRTSSDWKNETESLDMYIYIWYYLGWSYHVANPWPRRHIPCLLWCHGTGWHGLVYPHDLSAFHLSPVIWRWISNSFVNFKIYPPWFWTRKMNNVKKLQYWCRQAT